MSSPSLLTGLPSRTLLTFIGVLFAFLVGAGCSPENKTAKHLTKADAFFTEGQFDRAEIEYLNVLKENNRDAHALGRLGRIYLEQGKLGRAFPLLVGVKELAPDHLDNRIKLGQFFLAAGRRKEALDEATYVLSKRPNDPEAPLILGEAAALPDQIAAARAVLSGLPQPATQSASVLTALGFLSAREGDSVAAERYMGLALAADPTLPAAHTGAALIAISKGDARATDAAFAKASEASKPRSRERLQYAAFKLQIGDLAAGKRLLEEITRQTPDYLPALIRQIDLAGAEKRFDDAATLLKSVQSQDPTNPEALIAGARLALVRGNFALSLSESEKLIKLYPQFPPAHFEAARAHMGAGDNEKAVESLNRALQLSPDYPEATLLLATLDLRRGNRSSAIVALRQLVSKRPGSVDAQLLLAEAYRSQRENDLALEIYDRLLKASPTNDRVALLKGLALLDAKRVDEARAVFESVYQRTPTSEAALEQLTSIDVATKRPEAARSRLETAMAAAPKSANLRIISAQLYFATSKTDLGEQELRKAIELQPEQLIAYGMLAQHFFKSGALDKALEQLQVVVQRNPKDLGAWTLAGTIHSQRSDWARAREAYEKALAINPRFFEIQNNLALILFENFGELDRAYELAKSAHELAPGNAHVADTLGWLLYQRGDFVQALRLLRDSAERLPQSAEGRYHLGMAQYAVGDDDAAVRTLESSIAQEPQAKWVPSARRRLAILNTKAPASASQRSELDAHLKENPNDAIAWSRLADLQEHQGARSEALATREKVVKLAPQNGRALVALARLHQANGDRDKALSVARDARKVAPEDTAVALELGRLTLDARDYPTASGLLQEVARKAPATAGLYYDLGHAMLAIGRVDEARSAWTRALELESLSDRAPATRERLTLLGALRGEAPSASNVALARKRLVEEPSDLTATMVLARASQQSGDKSAVVDLLRKAVSAYPDYLPARRSLILALAGNPSEDRQLLELSSPARDLLSNDREVSRVLGFASYRTGEHRRATVLLENVVRQVPNDSSAWFHLALAQQELKQNDAAKASLQKAVAAGLQGEEAKRAQSLLEGMGK